MIKPGKKKEFKRKFERETKSELAYRCSGFYFSLFENAKEANLVLRFLFICK